MLGQTFFTQCPKLIAKTIFLKERFSLDTLWVNLKSTSGISAGKIITHAELFLTRRPRVPDIFKKIEFFFLKKYLWTCRMQYQQTCRIVFAIIPGSFAQCPSMKLEGVRFEKNTNCSYRNLDCSFDIPAAKKISCQMPMVFQSLSRNFQKIFVFSKGKNLPKRFLWTRRLQFWQTCRKNFATGRKFFCFLSENDWEKKDFFFKLFIPRKFPMDTENEVLTTLSKSFCQKTGVNLPLVQKCSRKQFLDEKIIFVEISFRTRKTQI